MLYLECFILRSDLGFLIQVLQHRIKYGGKKKDQQQNSCHQYRNCLFEMESEHIAQYSILIYNDIYCSTQLLLYW